MLLNLRINFIVVLLVIILTSCAPETEAISSETLAPTSKLAPSSTPIPTLASTPIFETGTEPTLLPTQLTALAPQPTILVLTPDADQVERWQEYEAALGKKLLGKDPFVDETLCEWNILGRDEREVYVWAVCTGTNPVGDEGFFPTSSIAVVIYLNEENDIEGVDKPAAGSYAADIRNMFPPEIQEMIFDHILYDDRLLVHLEYRREHPEPPLIVLETTPTP